MDGGCCGWRAPFVGLCPVEKDKRRGGGRVAGANSARDAVLRARRGGEGVRQRGAGGRRVRWWERVWPPRQKVEVSLALGSRRSANQRRRRRRTGRNLGPRPPARPVVPAALHLFTPEHSTQRPDCPLIYCSAFFFHSTPAPLNPPLCTHHHKVLSLSFSAPSTALLTPTAPSIHISISPYSHPPRSHTQ